jgi:hypothetical protein
VRLIVHINREVPGISNQAEAHGAHLTDVAPGLADHRAELAQVSRLILDVNPQRLDQFIRVLLNLHGHTKSA